MKTETPRQTAERITARVAQICGCNWERCVSIRAATIAAIEAALNAERERSAEVADLWANSHSCDAHDDNPCCHVRTGVAIAGKIRDEGLVKGELVRFNHDASKSYLIVNVTDDQMLESAG